MFIFIIFFLISLCGKTRENFYRSVALNILNTIKVFNTTNHTSRFLFEDYCNSSKNPSSEIHDYISKIVSFEILHLITCFYMFENMRMNDMLEHCIKILNRTSSNFIPKYENKQLTCSNFLPFLRISINKTN